jgi:hypothetical protein
MSKNLATRAIALILLVVLVAPVTFFIAPQRASAASSVGCIGGIVGGAATANGAAAALSVPDNSFLGNLINTFTAGSTLGTCINDLIVVPLIRAAIRAILQQMTASVINWINGGNGTGQPSFVMNLSAHLQSLGDATVLPFIAMVATGFNSPFGAAISSSLLTTYAQQSSLAGFFAANQCTLSRFSSNPSAFVAGNWSQGGIPEWFALTGPTANNPYILNQAVLAQANSNIGQAVTNRRQDLVQSRGYLSFCTTNNVSTQTLDWNNFSASSPQSTSIISPGDPCTNGDGTQGKTQTPGSLIADYANKGIASAGFDQMNALLVSANDIDSAFSAITTALINQVLGSTGLLGASQSSSSGGGRSSALTSQLQNYADSSANATQSAFLTAQSKLADVTTYTNSWNTIVTAANTASTSLASLASFCTAAAASTTLLMQESNSNVPAFRSAATAQVAAAQSAITSEVAPVLAQAQTATNAVAATQTFGLQVEAESSGTSVGVSLASDVATLVTMPPSPMDTAGVQMNATVGGSAAASPPGSVTVTRGTLVDQMNLISANAEALKSSVCTYHPSPIPSFFGG